MDDSRRLSRAHLTATIGLAFLWFYQGLVPKVIVVAQDEIDFWLHFGLDADLVRTAVILSGVAEMVFAVLVVVFRRHRWPFVLTIVAMVAFLVTSGMINPSDLAQTYNPVVGGIGMITLAIIALITLGDGSEGHANEAEPM